MVYSVEIATWHDFDTVTINSLIEWPKMTIHPIAFFIIDEQLSIDAKAFNKLTIDCINIDT